MGRDERDGGRGVGGGALAGGSGAGASGSSTGAKRWMNAAIAIAIVAACVSAVVLQQLAASSSEASVAVVTDGDGNVYELPLDQDTELTITTSLGTNVVQVQDGEVRVLEADCPNQDCVEMGFISSPGQQIICLPHELVVEISGGDDSESDVISS